MGFLLLKARIHVSLMNFPPAGRPSAGAHGPGPGQDLPGKVSYARCPRPILAKQMQHWRQICSIDENVQHWRNICSICEKYAALPTNMQHRRKHIQHCRTLCKLLCFLTCVLQKVVKTEAKWVEPSPSTAPAHKKYSGGHRS